MEDMGGPRCGQPILVRDRRGEMVILQCEAQEDHAGLHMVMGEGADEDGNNIFKYQLTFDTAPGR